MKKTTRKIFSLVLCLIMIICTSMTYAYANTIELTPESYKEGYEFGQNNKLQIEENILSMKEKAKENNIDLNDLKEKIKDAEKFYKKVLPDKINWIKGLSDSTNISYEDILILNSFDKKIVGFEGECTTLMANGEALDRNEGTIIMKNRDQGANALCEVSVRKGATHNNWDVYKAAYIDIPETNKTYKVVANHTAGRWGYGMGINEHQVIVADNDAPSRDILDFKAGLHDNDVVRLVLERAKTAREGVDIVAKLVEKYGQAWNGIMFEIGDPEELWVVEVTGRRWVAKKYTDTVTARSNQYEIERDYNLSSDDLIDFAIEKGWVEKDTEWINFKEIYSCDVGYPDDNILENRKNVSNMYNTQMRYNRAMEILEDKEGYITYETFINGARDHYDTYTLPSGKTIELNQVPFYSTDYANWENREFLKEEPRSDNAQTPMYIRGVCGHDIGWGRTISSAVLIARPDVENELGLMLHALGTPCKSVYVPFYVGIDKVHEGFETPTAAVLFKNIDTRTFGFYNMYHDAMRKHFDEYEKNMLNNLERIERRFEREKDVNILDNFVYRQCAQAIEVALKVQSEITKTAVDWYSWTPRDMDN